MSCPRRWAVVITLALASPVLAQPSNPLDLARGLRDQQLPDLALEYLTDLAARTADPDLRADILLETAQARLAVAATEPDEGKKEALAAAVTLAANDRRALLGVVSTAVRLKMAFAVQAAVEAALGKDPSDPDFLGAKAVLLLEAQAYAPAVGALAEAIRLQPKDARLRFLAGVAELRSNHVDKALSHFKNAMNLAPDNARYALGYAHALDRKGSKEVLAAWQRVVQLDPTDPEPHVCAALWLYAKGRHEDAAAEVESAIKKAPKDPVLRYYLAILHGDRLGMLGLALDDLREYKRLGGDEPEALEWLEALEAMGK
jgi:Flp pilus assembly protein TadD